jgi:hypothetical protein
VTRKEVRSCEAWGWCDFVGLFRLRVLSMCLAVCMWVYFRSRGEVELKQALNRAGINKLCETPQILDIGVRNLRQKTWPSS